jgi:transcriptional regulator with XRE-family HTH domain
MVPPRSIGPKLRQLRLAAGLTQADLAEKAGLVDATVSRIERGRLTPSIELVRRLAASLGTTVDDLLAVAVPPQSPGLRQSEARLLAVVRDLDDAGVDDVTKALKTLLGVSKRLRRN